MLQNLSQCINLRASAKHWVCSTETILPMQTYMHLIPFSLFGQSISITFYMGIQISIHATKKVHWKKFCSFSVFLFFTGNFLTIEKLQKFTHKQKDGENQRIDNAQIFRREVTATSAPPPPASQPGQARCPKAKLQPKHNFVWNYVCCCCLFAFVGCCGIATTTTAWNQRKGICPDAASWK